MKYTTATVLAALATSAIAEEWNEWSSDDVCEVVTVTSVGDIVWSPTDVADPAWTEWVASTETIPLVPVPATSTSEAPVAPSGDSWGAWSSSWTTSWTTGVPPPPPSSVPEPPSTPVASSDESWGAWTSSWSSASSWSTASSWTSSWTTSWHGSIFVYHGTLVDCKLDFDHEHDGPIDNLDDRGFCDFDLDFFNHYSFHHHDVFNHYSFHHDVFNHYSFHHNHGLVNHDSVHYNHGFFNHDNSVHDEHDDSFHHVNHRNALDHLFYCDRCCHLSRRHDFWEQTDNEVVDTLAACIAKCDNNESCHAAIWVDDSTSADYHNCWQVSSLPTPSLSGIALLVKLLSPQARAPTRGSAQSAGHDLYASQASTIPARGKALVSTGIAIACPPGTYGRVAPRSGLAAKHSIDTGAGVIDADYRGEVKVLLFNLGEVDFPVAVGDRIAQLVLER
ncbi:hypothetical protein DV735_g529, partial [Chaetothyriales sp. CBS 134920]